jgi:hypothetical protein
MALSPSVCALNSQRLIALLGCIVINLAVASTHSSVKGASSVLRWVENVCEMTSLGVSNVVCVVRLFSDVRDCFSGG